MRRNLVALSRSGRIAELPRKELRYAPWLLWNGEPPAAGLPGLLPILLDQARASTSTLRRLIGAYLRDFDPQAPGIDEAAACIRRLLAGAGPRFDLWRTAQSEVHLFEPTRGPAALAARLLADEQPAETLARYKLDDPMLSVGKYLMAVEEAVRAAAPQMLRNQRQTGLERVRRVVAPSGALRFEAQAGATGRAVLRAWLDGGPEPEPALQQPVREMLLRWLGDPRLRPQSWAGVGEQETSLMRRWLTRASLDLFFKLIDRHALDQHWRYRHAFWLTCLEKGGIADAWLALGSQTFSEAGTIRDLGGAYGRLKGGAADQSALLLRVGPLVIGEFTHNGSLRAWPADWPEAPRLGQSEYASAKAQAAVSSLPAQSLLGQRGRDDGERPVAYQQFRRLLAGQRRRADRAPCRGQDHAF